MSDTTNEAKPGMMMVSNDGQTVRVGTVRGRYEDRFGGGWRVSFEADGAEPARIDTVSRFDSRITGLVRVTVDGPDLRFVDARGAVSTSAPIGVYLVREVGAFPVSGGPSCPCCGSGGAVLEVGAVSTECTWCGEAWDEAGAW